MKKVLRAIGGFFAKIGRWIANTAWIQPLLIVGGIFAIIFSIPYIKKGIEGLIAGNQVDAKEAFYSNRQISLAKAEVGDGESELDTFFNLVEANDAASKKEIKNKYGEKFFLSFVKRDCPSCKEVVDGYVEFENLFYSEYKLDKDPKTQAKLPNYKFYSVYTDTLITDANSKHNNKYASELVLYRHSSLFERLAATYGEQKDLDGGYKYHLLNNADSGRDDFITSVLKLGRLATEGLDVPATFFFDFSEGAETYCNINGINAIYFNFKSFISNDADNVVTQAQFLRDCWTYSNAFSPSGKDVNYYYKDAE